MDGGTKWIEVEHARIRRRRDGVAEVVHDDGVLYSEALARAHIEQFKELLSDAGRAPLLMHVPSGFKLEDDARRFLLSAEMAATFTSGAMLFGRRLEALAVSAFLRVATTGVPMKAFTKERSALTWLLGG